MSGEMRRALVRIVANESDHLVVIVPAAAWTGSSEDLVLPAIRVKKSDLPDSIRDLHAVSRVFAFVNIGAERAEDARFEAWEPGVGEWTIPER